MDGKKSALGEFLQARRAQVRPEDLGLISYGDQRRVPGLRREELAQLAGVSASYYARLEQGQSLGASVEVLEAIATALRLDDAERRHLLSLAATAQTRPARRPVAPERVSADVRDLVTALGEVPVLVLGRRSDVLAWNRSGHALYGGHLDAQSPGHRSRRPNLARMLFLDSHTRELYADWPRKARAVVAGLRMASAEHPGDPAFASLIGELTLESPEFASIWSQHRVKTATTSAYELRHPVIGALRVTQQSLRTEQDLIVVVTTAPDDASREALSLLAGMTTTEPVRVP